MRLTPASIFAVALVAGCSTSTPMTSPDATVARDLATAPGPDLSSSADLAMAGPCDLIKQNCPDPILSKCAAVDDGSGVTVAPMCVMPTGGKATGDACTRINNMASGEGYDDCAKGNYCSGLGSLSVPPVRHCRAFCMLDADCKNSEHCSTLINTPPVGLCVPVCAPFGTDCAQGLNCSNVIADSDMVNLFVACREPGMTALAGTCMTDADCVADAICAKKGNTNSCAALCDMSGNHNCTNSTCMPLVQGSMLGICQ